MATLTYKAEQSVRGTLITFNKRPPQRVRDQLESVGFKYHAQWKTWIGKTNVDKAIAIANEAVKRKADMQYAGTLCWECDNACGKCSWSKRFVPVEGWTAKKTTLSLGYFSDRRKVKKTTSYHVVKCPEYSPNHMRRAVDG